MIMLYDYYITCLVQLFVVLKINVVIKPDIILYATLLSYMRLLQMLSRFKVFLHSGYIIGLLHKLLCAYFSHRFIL